ncbi:hypothetical protein C8R46DRAFT_1295276 [Mycena filopes]|nr:hypothetical protein C8R46DRAFT_1295276 [Mycena filopes]
MSSSSTTTLYQPAVTVHRTAVRERVKPKEFLSVDQCMSIHCTVLGLTDHSSARQTILLPTQNTGPAQRSPNKTDAVKEFIYMVPCIECHGLLKSAHWIPSYICLQCYAKNPTNTNAGGGALPTDSGSPSPVYPEAPADTAAVTPTATANKSGGIDIVGGNLNDIPAEVRALQIEKYIAVKEIYLQIGAIEDVAAESSGTGKSTPNFVCRQSASFGREIEC